MIETDGIHSKISLSPQLEDLYFGQRLRQREVDALKQRCESYQEGHARQWSQDILPAYAQYFGFLSSLKIKALLTELKNRGYLDVWQEPVSIYDFGAGTLGGSLGALDFFQAQKVRTKSLTAFDRDTAPARWARERFASCIPKDFKVAESFPETVSLDNSLFLSVDVLNEMGLAGSEESISTESFWFKMVDSWIQRLTPSSILILIEPANRSTNRCFLRLRDEIRTRKSILLPCTHCFSCPALKESEEWCHEDRQYKAPSSYWNLVHSLNFQRQSLSFSMLVLGGQPSKFKASDARMVSRNINSKGKCEKWLCANGRRWKVQLLNRHKTDENADIF